MRRHSKSTLQRIGSTLPITLLFLWACGGEVLDTGPEGQRAIQIVKAYTPEGGLYTVISNIEKMAADSERMGDKWEEMTWEAGLPSQRDVIMARLSEYFTFVRPTGNYWVRFTYKDKEGTHTALWSTNIYTREVEPQNNEARKFTLPQSPQT